MIACACILSYVRPKDDEGATVQVGLKELVTLHTHPVDYTYPELELQQCVPQPLLLSLIF